MAFTIVGHAFANAPTGTTGINTTGADLLIICQNAYNTTTALNADIVDSKGNAYTQAARIVSTAGTSQSATISYKTSPAVGSGHTVLNTASGFAGTIELIAVSGSGASPLDVVNSARISGGTSDAPGSVTPTQSGDLCIAFYSIDTPAGSTFSVGSGFTILDFFDVIVGTQFGLVSAYLQQGAAAAVNPALTRNTGTGQDLALIATFKGTGGVAAEPPYKRSMRNLYFKR